MAKEASKAGTKYVSNNSDEARFAQLVKTLDEEMLGSLLYSQWRYVTHWSYSEDFTPQLGFFKVILRELISRSAE